MLSKSELHESVQMDVTVKQKVGKSRLVGCGCCPERRVLASRHHSTLIHFLYVSMRPQIVYTAILNI